jgi:phenylacetate-CoA ligase
MSASGRFLFPVTQRLRRSGTMKILRSIRSEPYLSRPQILEHQFLRLSRLLAIAEAHVPYYREMFRSLGIHSHDIRSLDDFASLPVLTKDIIRERQDDLLREDVPKKKLIVGHSGGSTGVPLRFYRSRADLDACDAGTFRNCLQSGWKPGDMVAFIWGFNQQLWEMSAWEFELRQRLRRMYQFDPFHSGAEQMDRWLAKWKQIRPRVVIGYASAVARFAGHVESIGKRVDPLLGAFTTAEKLYPAQRETISRVFGCEVYDMYGSSEVNNIACTCSHRKMHVSADCVVLEVDRTQALLDLPSPFIVTSLWNEVMPFIRYRNEDCGELLEGSCNCGNQFPLMKLNISRVSDNFTLPSGEVVHGEFFTHLMYGSKGIAMFQFHQTAPNSITLWIVPNSGHAAAREEAIRLAVEQVEGLDATRTLRIQVQETEAIPLSRNGKHRFTISDVRAESTSRSLPFDLESELA